MNDSLISLFDARHGHFEFESGHHGELWLDLEKLCHRPSDVWPFAEQLAASLAGLRLDAVCGPLNEGAFVALMVARELNVRFVYAERKMARPAGGFYPVDYRIPRPLRAELRGRRVTIVNDVINAGSAVRGAWEDLVRCEAEVVAVAALLVLGDWSSNFVKKHAMELVRLESLPNRLWKPSDCPHCAAGTPVHVTDEHDNDQNRSG